MVHFFNGMLPAIGIPNLLPFEVMDWPTWAHLRYHWMENLVYRSIEYLPLALIGIGSQRLFYQPHFYVGSGALPSLKL